MSAERITELEATVSELLESEHSLSERCNRLARHASDIELDREALAAHVRDLERDPSGRSTAPIVHFMNEAKKLGARAQAAEQVLEQIAQALMRPDPPFTVVMAVHARLRDWKATRGGE